MRFIEVWITCPDRDVAERIAQAVVERRLAACANIMGEVRSVYRWLGAIERADEIALVLKTRGEMFDQIAALAGDLHPYEVPAIVAMDLTHVAPAYASWLAAETA